MVSASKPPNVPVIIICRDRLTPLMQLIDWLENQSDCAIWLVDNNSTYPPLVAYLQDSPHHVLRMPRNLGHQAPWRAGILPGIAKAGRFVVTDPDIIPDDCCPRDVFERLDSLLDRYPRHVKVGLGLRIDDLPANYALRSQVQAWEAPHWTHEVETGVFEAPVDTTFAMYRQGAGPEVAPALRTGHPYVARHLDWYLDSDQPSDELLYYRAHAKRNTAHWGQETLPQEMMDMLAGRAAKTPLTREARNVAGRLRDRIVRGYRRI